MSTFTKLLLLTALALLSPTAASAAERLVLPPYPATSAWQEPTNQRAGAKFLIERIPADQQIEAYKDILTAQSFPELAGQDPAEYFTTFAGMAQGACEKVSINGPKAQVENGVRVVYGQVYCSRQNGRDFGVQMFFKVLEGADGLYVVQREFRVPPSAQAGMLSFPKGREGEVVALMKAVGVGNDYLVESVYLCGGPSTDARCK